MDPDSNQKKVLQRDWVVSVLTVAAMLLTSCGESAAPDEPPSERLEPGADTIRCTLSYRASNELLTGQDPADPVFDFIEEEVSFRIDEGGFDVEETFELSGLTLEASVASNRHEGGEFHLWIAAGETHLFRALYQFRHGGVPRNVFGSQGFTGLIYLTHPEEGGDYQLICESLATGDGAAGGGA